MKGTIITTIILAFFVMAYSQERPIKPGDTIDITVYNHPELSRVVSVSSQGTIDFPFMQSLPVDGLTLDRLREIVVTQLTKYLNTYPLVTLSYAKTTTLSVNVLGMVNKPGVIQLPLYSTLQSALSMAGGYMTGSHIQEVSLTRVVKDETVTSIYNLEKFLLEGDWKNNPFLQDGDIILITGNPFLGTVKVLGAVYKPGAYDSYMGANLFDMLLLAGGPTVEANLKSIKFISTSRKKTINISFNMEKYLSAADYSRLPRVEGGDIIIVKLKRNYLKSLLSVVGTVGTLATAFYYISWYRRLK
jgi:protein involved in polysaccharide export with SLBB domain